MLFLLLFLIPVGLPPRRPLLCQLPHDDDHALAQERRGRARLQRLRALHEAPRGKAFLALMGRVAMAPRWGWALGYNSVLPCCGFPDDDFPCTGAWIVFLLLGAPCVHVMSDRSRKALLEPKTKLDFRTQISCPSPTSQWQHSGRDRDLHHPHVRRRKPHSSSPFFSPAAAPVF